MLIKIIQLPYLATEIHAISSCELAADWSQYEHLGGQRSRAEPCGASPASARCLAACGLGRLGTEVLGLQENDLSQ